MFAAEVRGLTVAFGGDRRALVHGHAANRIDCHIFSLSVQPVFSTSSLCIAFPAGSNDAIMRFVNGEYDKSLEANQ
jgi:hypothetical protein